MCTFLPAGSAQPAKFTSHELRAKGWQTRLPIMRARVRGANATPATEANVVILTTLCFQTGRVRPILSESHSVRRRWRGRASPSSHPLHSHSRSGSGFTCIEACCRLFVLDNYKQMQEAFIDAIKSRTTCRWMCLHCPSWDSSAMSRS